MDIHSFGFFISFFFSLSQVLLWYQEPKIHYWWQIKIISTSLLVLIHFIIYLRN